MSDDNISEPEDITAPIKTEERKTVTGLLGLGKPSALLNSAMRYATEKYTPACYPQA